MSVTRCPPIAALAAVSLALPAIASSQTTALLIDSQHGDHVGQGREVVFTTADFPFSAPAGRSTPSGVQILLGTSFAAMQWRLDFAAPRGETLVVGRLYRFTQRTASTIDPRLEVVSLGGACNTMAGHFRVLELIFTPDGDLERFAADFEQYCESSASAALWGAIRFNSTVVELTPFA
jgi:hypothetical protein